MYVIYHYSSFAVSRMRMRENCLCVAPETRSEKMAGAASGTEKEPVNIVHRNAIFCETIRKEQRDQKLYTSYGVNPYKKSKPDLCACAL